MNKYVKSMIGIAALAIASAMAIDKSYEDNTPAKDSTEIAQPKTKRTKTTKSRTSTAQTGKSQEVIADLELARTAKSRKSVIARHLGYTTSFNATWQEPNWVAYSLTKEEAEGTEPRPKKQFEPDPDIPSCLVQHKDYTNSGYSRGHMAPAADMRWSPVAMEESFYLSNICPQKDALNDGIWKRLEERVRSLAKEGVVYVCCGPIVKKNANHIGIHGVAVPDKFFKVLCMKRGGEWQAIGFVFPNGECEGSMFDYAMSVDKVEKLTGHDFFYNMPDDVEETMESNIPDWK